jgi:polar amino acid transport system substrate-binding protein
MLVVGMLITGLLATVIGCKGEQQKAGDNTPKEKLVVGTEATFPPFEMIENGEYTGFDMEIIRAIGESQGC